MTSPNTTSTLERIRARQARVGVIGLGYVGLPLAVEFARAGFDVTGFDVDAAKIDADQRRQELHPGRRRRRISPPCVKAGKLRATTDMSAARRDGRDRHLRADAAAQDQGSRPVVHRARGRSGRRDAAAAASSSSSSRRPIRARPTKWSSRCSTAKGFKADVDFFLAFSPERVDPGNPQFNTKNIPKIVGGVGPASTEVAAALYGATVAARHPGQLDARRRDGEAAREHVPRGEHRPGQRDRADVPQDGHRRVGSDRRGEDQAVRLHAVLSRARASAATASRSIRSICRGRRGRAASSAASSSWPARSTARCRSTSSQRVAEALNSSARSRSTARASTCSAWPTSRTSATCASRRRSTSSSCSTRQGAVVSYTDPYVAVADARRPDAAVGADRPTR